MSVEDKFSVIGLFLLSTFVATLFLSILVGGSERRTLWTVSACSLVGGLLMWFLAGSAWPFWG